MTTVGADNFSPEGFSVFVVPVNCSNLHLHVALSGTPTQPGVTGYTVTARRLAGPTINPPGTSIAGLSCNAPATGTRSCSASTTQALAAGDGINFQISGGNGSNYDTVGMSVTFTCD
jgi:hypothetical protein